MENLKLGQIIFVTTTILLDGQIFKLHKTKLDDAIKNKYGTHIKMANDNNWGACPTRNRDEVVAQPQDLDVILEKWTTINEHRQEDEGKPKKNVYKVEFCERRSEVIIEKFNYHQKVQSLKEGSYLEYTCRGSLGVKTLKVPNEVLPNKFFYTMDEAVEEVRGIIKNSL